MGLGLGLGMAGRETDRDRERGGADLLCTLSSEVRRSQESLLDSPHNPNSAANPNQAPPSSISSVSQAKKGINVKVGVFLWMCFCDLLRFVGATHSGRGELPNKHRCDSYCYGHF